MRIAYQNCGQDISFDDSERDWYDEYVEDEVLDQKPIQALVRCQTHLISFDSFIHTIISYR